MHEKDRKKIMEAGFALYRCSESEKVIKRRNINDASWKTMIKLKTKVSVREIRKKLLSDPKAIQD